MAHNPPNTTAERTIIPANRMALLTAVGRSPPSVVLICSSRLSNISLLRFRAIGEENSRISLPTDQAILPEAIAHPRIGILAIHFSIHAVIETAVPAQSHHQIVPGI